MQNFRKSQEPAVDKLKEPVFDEITSALVGRYGLNFTRQDPSSLWFLCKQVITYLCALPLFVWISNNYFWFWRFTTNVLLMQWRLLFPFTGYNYPTGGWSWQEASLLDITNQACRLFSPFEVYSVLNIAMYMWPYSKDLSSILEVFWY